MAYFFVVFIGVPFFFMLNFFLIRFFTVNELMLMTLGVPFLFMGFSSFCLSYFKKI